MSAFSVERSGFVDCQVLIKQLFVDLEANGFLRKFPSPLTPLQPTDYKAVYEAGPNVDVLAPGAPLAFPAIPAGSAVTGGVSAQPWRLLIQAVDATRIMIAAATPLQISDTGTTTYLDDGKEISGHIGAATNADIVSPTNTLFYNRSSMAVDQQASSPMSYRLTITTHGMALFIWESGNDHLGNAQSWFVIQRMVNNTSGTPRVTGKAPVVCVYGIRSFGGIGTPTTPIVNKINRFTVRETDIVRPTVSIPANVDNPDAARVINSENSVAITEDNNYVISFPNGLNTNRFAYPVDELDLIAYTSADVISQNADVNITVYNEATPRVYKAMCASDIDNTGIRMLVLASGG